MKLFDQHLHSKFSFDSKTEPIENVRRAVELGLAGLTFTEHYDTHPDEWEGCVYDDEPYTDALARCRHEFGDRIFIGKGIEIDYQRDNMPAIIDFLDSRQFDMVILSIHWSAGRPIHLRDVWNGRDPSAVTREYLESVLEAVRYCEDLHARRGRVFDVLGHLDFAKRYSDRFLGSVHVLDHMDVVNEILQTCLSADIVPEVNTSTLRGGLGEPMPGPEIIKRYAELGGKMMSLGSDAHKANQIASGLEEAAAMLQEAGISQAAVFQQRKRDAHDLA
jgi:histidinol-phosphatase (PHP family)